jgi:hypothetical protein
MKLRDFVNGAIVEMMHGIDDADKQLKKNGVGSIAKDNFGALNQTLVHASITKKTDKTTPILLVGFDIAVVVQEQSGASDKASVGIGAFLSVVGFGSRIEGESSEKFTSSNTHRITFTVPLSFEVPSP